MDGRFALRTGVPDRLAAGLTGRRRGSLRQMTAVPQPLDRLLTSNAQMATLNRLVARGLVHVAGFTPSDAAHVLGLQSNWDAGTARLGAELFARRRDGRGQPIARRPKRSPTRADGADAAVGRSDPGDRLRRGWAGRRGDRAHALVQRAVDGGPASRA
jgi:hypothetical protein